MLGNSRESQLQVSHAIKRVNNRYSTVYFVDRILGILCFVFSRSSMFTKCPSVSPDSGEKMRKAITLSDETHDNYPAEDYPDCSEHV